MATLRPAFAISVLAALTSSCGSATPEPQAGKVVPSFKSPMLAEWKGPYGGLPAFEKMQLAELEPAVKEAQAAHLAELEAIAANPEPPTFENTIVAMERAGEGIRRIEPFFGVWSSNLSTPEFRVIEQRIAQLWSEYETRIVQNHELFARVKSVHESAALSERKPAERRLVKLIYDRFARSGAELTGEKKKRYAQINKRLASLYTTFGANVLADEEGYVFFLDEAQLGGLPESVKAASAAAAAERGKPGKYAITNTRSSMDPFLTYSTERSLREMVWRTYYNRGDNGDEHDNNQIISEILKLRHERVQLLGYENYAQWRLENRMAKTPKRAMALMEAVWPAAVKRAREEVADMQKVADREGNKIGIEPWDYRYYANKVRLEAYALDTNEVKEYLQLDNLREAMFMVAGELFGYSFSPVPKGSVPVFHPDVKVWEVKDKDTGAHVGLWYLDPFARSGKHSGAWATSYRSHTTFDGKKTVLSSNNSNFVKGAPGQPVLISWDDARTFFHEFGHALHSLSSNVEYPTLNGGVRDYTEFQSQLLERWLLTDKVTSKYLVHYKTGKPIPAALVAKIKKASTFNQGFATVEYLASALLDMKYHTTSPEGLDPDAFEKRVLGELGMPREVVMRHRSPHFSHAFSGEGYAAGYYGYLWAEVLTADAAEAFAESSGGFYDRAWAKKLVEHLFAPRNSVDPAEVYRVFRGRDAAVEALMRDRGFARYQSLLR